jgi:hypothetical protein
MQLTLHIPGASWALSLYSCVACSKYAWGQDEVDAQNKRPRTWFNVGLTIVDSIDTLLILGLEDEYQVMTQQLSELLLLFMCCRQCPRYTSSTYRLPSKVRGVLLRLLSYHGRLKPTCAMDWCTHAGSTAVGG